MDKVHSETQKLQAIIDASCELKEFGEDYRSVVDFVGDASVVLLGESTRGSKEFYKARATITKILIQQKGFNAVAVTDDFATCERLSQFVLSDQNSKSEIVRHESYADALSLVATPFPKWVWENDEMADFFSWLRMHNDAASVPSHKIGVHGLDLYNFYDSASHFIRYLDHLSPSTSAAARQFFGRIECFGSEAKKHKADDSLNIGPALEQSSIAKLIERLKNSPVYQQLEAKVPSGGEFLNRAQKLRVIAGAEQFYRNMLRDKASLCELRDSHMAETLQKIKQSLENRGQAPRVVVWAHNFDSGDIQATEMSRLREVNFGQLVKQAYGRDTVSIGLTTYVGTVTASSSWNGIGEIKVIPPAPSTSYEYLFHKTSNPRFFLKMNHASEVAVALQYPQTEMGLGLLFGHDTKRSNYFFGASLPFQFDAIIHFDRTQGLRDLEGIIPDALIETTPVESCARL